VNIGQRDRLISLQMKTVAENGYGEPIETWTTVASIWAQWVPMKASERFAAQQSVGELDGKWRIPWRRGVNAANTRILYDGTVYDIQPPIEMGRKAGLEIYAKAVNP